MSSAGTEGEAVTISNAERVRQALRQRIITGELAAGAHLNELGLSREFGVSRVPVREAIRALGTEGLVETRVYAGSRVSSLPAEDAEELFEIREVLERATARKAARRAQAAQETEDAEWSVARAEIDEILRTGDQALLDDQLELLAPLNIRFHQTVAEMGGSGPLAVLLRTISGSIERLYVADAHQRARKSWPEHHAIIAAIDAGDAELAGTTMAGHVRRSKRSYFRGAVDPGSRD